MSASKKKPVRRRSPARKTAGRKKPKVQLKNSSVIALCSVLAFLCGLLLFMNFMFAGRGSDSEKRHAPAVEAVSAKPSVSKPAEPDSEKVKPSEKKVSQLEAPAVNSDSGNQDKKNLPSEKKESSNVSIKPQERIASADNRNPVVQLPEKFNIPKASANATLVFIIDDAGLSVEKTKKYTSLPFPVTIAVLPKLSHSKDCAYLVRSSGKELILHQPMQSLNVNLNPGPGAITADMGTYDIARTVKENLDEIGPGVKGMNNHEGSLITSDQIKIGAVLEVCSERGIYFLDSRTTADTKAPQAALERDMAIFEKNAPYIDNVLTREAMLKEIYGCLEVANKKGTAIMIGHVDKSANILPALLTEMYPYLVEKGYRFATPSMLKK
ncbi:divergent polysaccharide deacetylase family protein [Treponema rectale]|uniref:Divergent polysaccharide deacetylase family protein n=1 Tax=Treponema rectale TaxID=744512 RepID=A0A840SER0_9SPIR|nr:divergent polysaccharide deacetylase family protein [Treponema rectale]MBB5219374.1 hypothetical protein [Treponema rectale]QOS40743.1 divergent polysaccharide deacetylase family protein [Treponema rectale]